MGCYVYQDGLDFRALRRIAAACEGLGYKILWLKDNFQPWLPEFLGRTQGTAARASLLEAWTALSALASGTTHLRLGTIFVAPYRNPALVAKMVASLDRISGGRVEVGFSAGWYGREFEAFGYTFLPPRERVRVLEEVLEIVTRLWAQGRATFAGRYCSVTKAACKPKPLQQPHPPLWVGGGGRHTLDLVVRFQAGWNFGPVTMAAFEERLGKLRTLAHGRWRRLRVAWHGALVLARTEAELAAKRTELRRRGLSPGDEKAAVIASTGSRLAKYLRHLQRSGVTDVTPAFLDLPRLDSLRLFATEVMPALT